MRIERVPQQVEFPRRLPQQLKIISLPAAKLAACRQGGVHFSDKPFELIVIGKWPDFAFNLVGRLRDFDLQRNYEGIAERIALDMRHEAFEQQSRFCPRIQKLRFLNCLGCRLAKCGIWVDKERFCPGTGNAPAVQTLDILQDRLDIWGNQNLNDAIWRRNVVQVRH